jgi:hypothetical protein
MNFLIHLFIWLVFSYYLSSKEADLSLGLFSYQTNSIEIPVWYGAFFNALIFYGNSFWLMPAYFRQKKRYYTFLIGLIFLISLIESSLDIYYAYYFTQIPRQEIYPLIPANVPPQNVNTVVFILLFLGSFPVVLIIHIVFWVFSLAYRLSQDWLGNEQRNQLLLQEKLQTEIKYLKSQINPHFLFNGINSIYHLIDKDTEQAKAILLMFSGLLRYQLYECNEDKILVSKELGYLENYISLEQIRKGKDVQIEWDFEVMLENQKIAPLLLTPFIENAFKYLSNYSESSKNHLYIHLFIENHHLELKVENTYQPELINQPKKAGGLGLENVKKRLNLIYPNQHHLVLVSNGRIFKVHLEIDLLEYE